MKKTTLLLTTFFIASIAISAFAQENKKNLRPVYRNGGFWDHWFISAGAGGQMYFGEDDNKAQIKDRISLSLQLAAGKWINHFIGARLQIGGLKLKGWNDGIAGEYRVKDPDYPYQQTQGLSPLDPQIGSSIETDNRKWTTPRRKGLPTLYSEYPWNTAAGDPMFGLHGGREGENGELYLQDLRYFDAHVDFLFNITSAIRGYSPTRFFNLIPYLGVGFAYEYGTENGLVRDQSFIPVGGMMFNFRLSKALDLGLDFKGVIVQESFDSHIGGETSSKFWTQEGYASATLNLTYKFKQREFEAVYEMDPNEIQQLNDRINALMVPVPVQACPQCPPAVEVPAKTKIYLAPVHFPLDVHIVPQREMYKVDLAAKFLTDDAARTLSLEGFADRKTGNPQYNQAISERRVREVRRLLVEKYGINPNRLSIGWEGDVVQPFDLNDLNRAVLFIGDEDIVTGGAPANYRQPTTPPPADIQNNIYRSR
ncbi:MAG: OmpA family protein [Candidatus Azobacteroides sp.]|nr:OmpA family protein [Candidatus Azobacteroides sp.]